MPPRRRRAVIPGGIFDSPEVASAIEKLTGQPRGRVGEAIPPDTAIDRFLDVATGPRPAAATVPGAAAEEDIRVQGVSGAGGAATGFGRRAIDTTDYDAVQWDEATPYPQVIPTRTSDPDRPRTVAMGYDERNRILRMTFRNGVTYEYLDVPRTNWDAVRRTPSPGRYIDDVLNQFYYRPVSD